MNHIPKHFTKSDLVLCIANRKVPAMEQKVLHMLACSIEFYYSKIESGGVTQFHFYCRPKYHADLAYRLGTYTQCLFQWHKPSMFINQHHDVPQPWPQAIHIPAYYNDKMEVVQGVPSEEEK